jgi:hypothetical protein
VGMTEVDMPEENRAEVKIFEVIQVKDKWT